MNRILSEKDFTALVNSEAKDLQHQLIIFDEMRAI